MRDTNYWTVDAAQRRMRIHRFCLWIVAVALIAVAAGIARSLYDGDYSAATLCAAVFALNLGNFFNVRQRFVVHREFLADCERVRKQCRS